MDEQQPPSKEVKHRNRQRRKKSAVTTVGADSIIDSTSEFPTVKPAPEVSKPKIDELPSAKAAPSKKPTNALKPPNEFTCIICAEVSDFYAVGICDHPICSICALRLRLVSKQKSCAICKQQMEFMIVSMFRNAVQPFHSFGLFVDTLSPGVAIDHSSSLHFVNCSKHNKDLNVQRAITCSVCHDRFPHKKELAKHLAKAHDVTMCQLCLDNLSLFVCEQQLYTKNDLRIHMNGKPGVRQGVHPRCEFCKTNVFDSMQLYGHMRDRHFSCYLCPSSHQHRFYKNIGDLELHFKSNHLTCISCFNQSPVGSRSYCVFRSNSEYRDHMLSEHNVSLPSNSTNHLKVAFKFNNSNRVGEAAADDEEHSSGEPVYLDLFVDEAPARAPDNLRGGVKKRQGGKAAAGAATAVPASGRAVQLVPDNMQIAGRVTGTGLFTRDASDDLFEQHSRELQQQRVGYAARVSRNASGVRHDNMFDFPTLPAEGTSAIATSVGSSSSQSLHPLSLVNRIAAKATASKATSASVAAGAGQVPVGNSRSEAFAEALGIKELHSQGGLVDYTRSSSMQASPPLFSPDLLTWAVQNKAVLLKTEKRISVFMEDKNASISLPPMLKPARDGIHGLVVYYGLTSHEYDHDPKRYISLVKTPTSGVPSVKLSVAAQKPWISVSAQLQKSDGFEPGVYISLQQTPKTPVYVSTILQRVDAVLSDVCAAEFGGMGEHSSQSFSNAMRILRPVKADLFNASTVFLEFSSLSVASRVYSTLSANIGQFGDGIIIIPAFSASASQQVPSASSMRRTVIDEAGFTLVRGKVPLDSWGEDIPVTISRAGANSDEDGAILEDDSIDSDYVVVEKVTTHLDSKIDSGLDIEGSEDWETVTASALAIPRTAALQATVPRGAPFVPFPKSSLSGAGEHYVPLVVEDPNVVAKREEDWLKFMDDHKRKPTTAATAEGGGTTATYQPPFRRLNTGGDGSAGVSSAPSRPSAQTPALTSNSTGSNISSSGAVNAPSSSAIVTRKKADDGKNKAKSVKASFSMLQLDDDSDSSDEN